MQKYFIAIDLKSFYASCECRERGLDPLTTNLVVADSSRTEKTICLAVSPSLKAYGIPGRARLFEVIQKVREVNSSRIYKAPHQTFDVLSFDANFIATHPEAELGFITAKPQMAKYMKYSTEIYKVYLKYFSNEDIFSYSIDEVFIDVTNYLATYKMKASDIATKVICDIYDKTGITATCGVGTNLYLAKVAMDVVAKHAKPNKYGVRIACLDEMLYRKLLWSHKPLTDFWRVGRGIAASLEKNGIYTMGDVALCSNYNEDKLYKLFGVNAELLIDHAWGYEPCTMQSIKSYKPRNTSLSSGQVLHCPYDFEKSKLAIKEMSELVALDLVSKHLVTNQIVMDVGYDVENVSNSNVNYKGEVKIDRYGRSVPKHAHGTFNFDHYTSSVKTIVEGAESLFNKIVNPKLLTRRFNICVNNLLNEDSEKLQNTCTQVDLFGNYKKHDAVIQSEKTERNLERSIIEIKSKYGKSAILKGMNFEDGGTTIARNKQIGGHSE